MPALVLGNVEDRYTRANARSHRYRTHETHLVQSIVQRVFGRLAHAGSQSREARNQRQREESVRDGSAEGRFTFAPLSVHVDPLVIVGGIGELVDAVLGDFKPLAGPE